MKKNILVSLYFMTQTYMKAIILILFIVFDSFINTFAAPVNEETAKIAGKNFLNRETAVNPSNLSVAYKSVSADGGINYFYIFSSEKSFVIVAADDRVTPVLGYSDEVPFIKGKLSPDIAYLFDIYTNQISYIINNNIAATAAINKDWNELITGSKSMSKTTTLVSPMLKTAWDQLPYYNALCPLDNSSGQRTVTGCVATAMAQVLKYWDYPKTGKGSFSYSDFQYGTQSASFANTSYDWANMPATVSNANSAVATLMYQCGVSVGMQYGTASGSGSAAYVIYDNGKSPVCAEKALKTYFNYASTLQGLKRANFTDAAWITLIENDLSAHHPIIYAGFETNGAGHCFVFDGFNSVHPYFHINWGWGGAYNGFFAIDALNPGGVGTGGGTGDFNSAQQAIIGIQPADPQYAGLDFSASTNSFTLYPNPAKDQINISFPQSNEKLLKVVLVNSQGQEVYSKIPDSLDQDIISINSSSLSEGIYFVQLFTERGLVSSKVVVDK